MKDTLLENRDLKFQNGDFAVGESLLQDAELILASAPGHWKQYPAIGVDLEQKLNDEVSFNDIKRDFKLHLKYDNKKMTDFKIISGKLNIDINYK